MNLRFSSVLHESWPFVWSVMKYVIMILLYILLFRFFSTFQACNDLLTLLLSITNQFSMIIFYELLLQLFSEAGVLRFSPDVSRSSLLSHPSSFSQSLRHWFLHHFVHLDLCSLTIFLLSSVVESCEQLLTQREVIHSCSYASMTHRLAPLCVRGLWLP